MAGQKADGKRTKEQGRSFDSVELSGEESEIAKPGFSCAAYVSCTA